MLTVQILTKNNSPTIKACLESLLPLKPQILVGDLGSQDDTIKICKSYGATVLRLGGVTRDTARNSLSKYAQYQYKMIVEPWEVFAKGQIHHAPAYATILHNHTLSKEVRIWTEGVFVNPVYERLDIQTDVESDVVLYCIGTRDHANDLLLIEEWKNNKPTSPSPYYYQACIYFSQQAYDQFYPIAEHYLFLDSKPTMASTMMRYYYAMATLVHKRKVRPVLQNLNLCLCVRPLMAEFWCLMADVYYHLLKKFSVAQTFYENAIILGARRLKTDKWPMDITKYSAYPKKMIGSCQTILQNTATYQTESPSR